MPNSTPAAGAIVLHVADSGRDAWSGRHEAPTPDGRDGPLRTFTGARDAVRRLRGTRAEVGPVTVRVQAGLHLLDESFTLESCDSGRPGAPVVYEAAAGAEVILAGATRLAASAFEPVSDPALLARLDPAARGQVRQIDLRSQGVRDLGEFPDHFQGFPAVPELFVNHRRMTLARWPTEGWCTIAQFIDPGSWLAPPGCPTTGQGGTFTCDDDRPARWNVDAGVWLHGYWTFDWFDEVIRVRAIDAANRQITLAAPARFGVKPRNPAPRRWCAINVLEELDSPGEYHIDRGTGLLCLWPDEPLHDACILLSTLRSPVVAMREVAHVIFRGFTLEASQSHGLEATGGRALSIEHCTVRGTGELGIRIEGGAEHRVTDCHIYDTGTGGLRLSGGDRRTLTPAGHVAINNHIHHFSVHRQTSAYGLWLAGVGNRAAHHDIHDAPHQAVAIVGNDHLFELSRVHHVCLSTDDCGALYKGRNPSCRGNVIRFNHWHDIGSPRGHGNGAIYFDDGDGGDLVMGNLFVRCCEPGRARWGAVYSHGGHGVRAQNNVFIGCKRALGSGPWSEERWAKCLTGADGHEWPRRLREEVDITAPPYTTRYPELIGFLDLPPTQARVSRAMGNLIFRCDDVCSGNWIVDEHENWITSDDPGFVDAANGDYRLRADAEVFRRQPGFVALPLERMGLLGPAAKAGT
jgi:hypothetical protein